MSAVDGALQPTGRPFVSSSLWVPLLLILIASAGILYYGHQVTRALQQSVSDASRAAGHATARELAGFFDREHERLRAFTEEKQGEIRQILTHPDDWETIEALRTSIRRMFRGVFAFTVTDADGRPLFEDYDGLVGPVCESAMRSFAASLETDADAHEMPLIHPVHGAYHFDLITPWRLADGGSGLFFISMSPNRIAEVLGSAEKASGTRILLVNRDEPTLIEVSAAGARDVLGDAFRLAPEALGTGHFGVDLPGTHWRLVVLPDGAALARSVRGVYMNVVGLFVALLLISAALLVAIRRFEQRNSSLFMRSLQSSVARQRAILQSMVDGMVAIDEKGVIHHVNNAVTRLFGYQPGELIGSNVRVLMAEPERSAHQGYLSQYLRTGERKIAREGRQLTARRKDGSRFPVLLTLGESIEGDERMFVGILHDMSDYEAAQRKIAAQATVIERSRHELEEISQMAARDLQAPLQRIASLGAVLGSDRVAALGGAERDQIMRLMNEARDMSELVKGLADYAHVERKPVEVAVDLDGILRDVQQDLAAAIHRTGALITVEPLGKALGNTKQLHQVFWNLLDNALKFRHPERVPAIRVWRAGDTDTGAASEVRVLIEDNGIGIPEDQLEAVFEAFRQLHPRDVYPGMGLGLSFCRKIVEGLGGRIDAGSRLGEGSRFRVILPCAK